MVPGRNERDPAGRSSAMPLRVSRSGQHQGVVSCGEADAARRWAGSHRGAKPGDVGLGVSRARVWLRGWWGIVVSLRVRLVAREELPRLWLV
jgi:hypothetical protein